MRPPGACAGIRLAKLEVIILDFYDCGIIEVGVLDTEDIHQRIADEVGIANHQVSVVMT